MIKIILLMATLMALQIQLLAQITITTGTGDSFTVKERAYQPCENGDIRPNEWDTGGIQLGQPKCGFKNIHEYNLLVDTLQKFNDIDGFEPVTWGIMQGGVLVEEHHGWAHYASAAFNYSPYRKDTVGAVISLNGVLYQRYMPRLSITKGSIYLGYDTDQSIPLCGCLRRVSIPVEMMKTKKIEILYSGSGKKSKQKQ